MFNVADRKTPPVIQSGKESLDFVTPAIQSLVVMGWLLAAATGRDARRDALLGQHLAESPITAAAGGRFEDPMSTSEVAALPLTQVGSRVGDHLCCEDPMELAGHAPLGATDQAGTPPVEAGRPGMGFEISGVNPQHLWLWGIGC